MERVLREHFAAVRQERGLTQTRVATRGGVKQSTISKIEIEPDYEPSVSSFLKAIHGLGLTASEFFAQIEALHSRADTPPSAPKPETDDEALPPFESEERISQRVLQLLLKRAVEGSPPERPSDHRLPPTARPIAAERSSHARQPRKRNVPQKKKRRRRRKPTEDGSE